VKTRAGRHQREKTEVAGTRVENAALQTSSSYLGLAAQNVSFMAQVMVAIRGEYVAQCQHTVQLCACM